MPAPTGFDGISRAIGEFAMPSVALIVFVAAIRYIYGAQAAGLAYLAVTAIVLLSLYSKATYWNVPYTFAVGSVGLLAWFGLPHVLPRLVPPVFATVGSIGGGAILFLIWLMTFEKL